MVPDAPDDRPTRPSTSEPLTTNPDDPGATQEDTMSTPTDTGQTPGIHPGAGAAPAAPTPPVGRAPARGMRVGTMVWGLVLAALGAGVLAWALGVSFDVELAFIVLVAAAGVLLLAGSLATIWRRRR